MYKHSITILLCAFILIVGCQTNEKNDSKYARATESTAAEKELVKKEIAARIDEIIKGAKALNVEAAIRPYADEPDFKIVSPDASVTDYATMKNVQLESFNSVASMDFTTIKQEFTFLEKDLVMCTWTGKNEFELKSGERMKIEPYVGSMLFRRKNNEWKIIYAHETAAPAVTIK